MAKGWFLGLTTVFLIGAAALTAEALPSWYNCTVGAAGPGDGASYVRLSHAGIPPAFEQKWFLLPAERAKEMLAVALTAMTNDSRVSILVDLEEAGIPELSSFFILRP